MGRSQRSLHQDDGLDFRRTHSTANQSGSAPEVNCFGTMSYGSTKRSQSSASHRSLDLTGGEDGDDKDETKRMSRNLSEKKRRDQFNILINELCAMVSNSPRKMDKSTVLKATIAFLKNHNELSVQSQVQETPEDWKPSFLSNEEFTYLMMESLDGFIIVISSSGQILYLSDSITSLLGHLSSDLVHCSIYNYLATEGKAEFHNVLSNPTDEKGKNGVSLCLNFRVGGFEDSDDSSKFQMVRIVGYFKRWITTDCGPGSETNTEKSEGEFSESGSSGSNWIFIATGRLIDADLLREMSVVVDTAKDEFSSRHSLEWKFLFLDHRAPPIIGYMPFEVLGTSGYDYYHAEDLEKVASCHEALIQKGEGTSCFYRFLTKGQQWIWLQTRFYITYHQWNSKPEFIVCTHRVVSYADVMRELRGEIPDSPSPRLTVEPSPSKQPKIDSKKLSISSSKSHRHRNGGINYGSMGTKRGLMRKVELPPKFVSALSTSHSVLLQPHKTVSQSSTSDFLEPSTVPYCSQSGNTTVGFHPLVEQFCTPIQQTRVLTVPIPTFPSPTQDTSNTQTIAAEDSNTITREQLLVKHALLQKQIMQQQEELRKVSEQLTMAQCSFLPRENSTTINQSVQTGVPSVQQTFAEASVSSTGASSGKNSNVSTVVHLKLSE